MIWIDNVKFVEVFVYIKTKSTVNFYSLLVGYFFRILVILALMAGPFFGGAVSYAQDQKSIASEDADWLNKPFTNEEAEK